MIAIVDYGMGNLRSVEKALKACGVEAILTSDSNEISGSKGVVLPGVGAFYRGMENLAKLNIIPAIYEATESGKPILGICLGLQLLFTESQEHGLHKGLDIIKGSVRKFQQDVKVPHMGWNNVKFKIQNAKSKIFDGVPDNSYFYFVHSYYVEPEDKSLIMATTEYGREFTSAVRKDNIVGVQFHPEKSTSLGLKILENFCRYVG